MPAPAETHARRRGARVALDAAPGNTNHDAPATPPHEFRIFRAGVNPSEKGDFWFDADDAAAVMAHLAAYGNRVAIDYTHSMVRPAEGDPAQAGKAAGWFTPALIGGELWATRITWTSEARALIADRAYAYFSPAFQVVIDAAGREHVSVLENVALTNIPAMHRLTPLVTVDRRAGRPTHARRRAQEKTMSKDELKQAIHAMHAKIHGEAYDEATKAVHDAKLDGMKMDALKAHHDKLAAMLDDAADGDGDSEPPPPPHKEPDGDEPDGDEAAAKHDVKADDEAEDRAHDRRAPRALPRPAAPAGDDVRALTGTVQTLSRELADVRAERAREKRAVILDRAKAEGRLSPADLAGTTPLGRSLARLSNDVLADLVAGLPKQVATQDGDATMDPRTPPAPPAGTTYRVELEKGRPEVTVTLSRDELAIARRMGNDPLAVARQKARRAANPWRRTRDDDAA